MSDPRITEEAVEAAAKAIYETPHDGLSRQGYDRAPRDIQKLYLAEAEAALEAALPHLIDDGAAAPPATPHAKPVAPGGEPAAVSATTTAAPSSPNPVTREALMVALHNEGAYCGNCDYEGGIDECAACRECLGAYADAVLALINGSQANG